ncbi:MAG TPA: MerR family transcriptional regulator, partial [Gemmatimonadaceae bacterium]|nr:MerR family transcriptional regulator [Gemmatimonadaceae bacterium]
MKEPPWKVGELARNTGMSVRALHHYDEIGLLRPSLRTAAGHRLYDRTDIERLQQIHSLRLMGISLDETKRLLDGAAASPRQVIDLHLARLREQMAMQKQLVRRLKALADHLDTAKPLSLEELCKTIEEMMRVEKYFTPEQLEVMEQRRISVGEERMHVVRDDWNEIIPKVRAAMENGADPTSPEVLALARRWKALVDEFTGGDPAIANAVKTMYNNDGPALQEKLG